MKRFSILSVLVLLSTFVGAENFSDSGGDSTTKPGFCVRRSRGHAQGREHIYSDDIINGLYGRGYGTSFATSNGVAIELKASQDWTASAQGTKIIFTATPDGSTTPATVGTLDGSGNFTPTGLSALPVVDVAVTTPTVVGALCVTSAYLVYVSTNITGVDGWAKVGGQ